MPDAPNCTTCGLCCVAPAPHNVGYVDASDYDGPDPARWLRPDPHHQVDAVMRQRRDGRCKALKGTVGACVSCAIYDHRPNVCYEYAPGGDACLAVRSTWGLGGPRAAIPVPAAWAENGPRASADAPSVAPLRAVGSGFVLDL